MRKKPTFSLLLLLGIVVVACEKPPARREKPVAPPVPMEREEGPRPLAAGLSLVRDGVATSAIVLPQSSGAGVREAAGYFAAMVERATGAKIPVVEDESGLSGEMARIYVGPSPKAAEAGLDASALPPETFRLKTVGNAVFAVGAADGEAIKGNPGVASRPTLWALDYLLDRYLGVRWLWPGELGTYVPKHTGFTLPELDVTSRPQLEFRSLRLLASTRRTLISRDREADKALTGEAIRWAENHQMGTRSPIVFGHNFGHWWEKYSKDHPDYFAQLPSPHEQPFPKPGAVKLRLANPAVIEQIAVEYEEAGKPKYWNVCPNDGSGFDISAETRAWDIPQNQPVQDIFQARGNLTARYVEFWNRLYERLKAINPEVVLVSYAYSSYRYPPPPERPLKARAVLQLVDSVEGFENWKAWAAYDADLFLRPNWWHQGADAPYLTLHKSDRFIRFAWEHRMLGLDMDSILGYWATQGANYYHVARLMTRPDLSADEIIAEYTEAFGAGKEEIKQYLAYWEEVADRFNYTQNATSEDPSASSEYVRLVNAGKVPRSILNGSKYALPYLYTDEVLAPALALLDEAERKIGAPESEAARRVAFLRKGLDSMKATRAQVLLGQELKRGATPERLRAFDEGVEKLEALREELSREHVVWAESTKRYEERYHILLRRSAFGRNEINLDGM